MIIPLIEPTSMRYIHINPVTNRVHLLVPFVGGQDISTDNTCRSTTELNAFFGGGGVRELELYKSVLEFHILLLDEGDVRRITKEERLIQINIYLDAVRNMREGYQATVNTFLSQPSNLYSIQLRPRVQDPETHVVNPVFTINRSNHRVTGTPLSPLYNKMHEIFPEITLGQPDLHQKLIEAVLAALPDDVRTHPIPDEVSFVRIQDLLTAKYIAQLPVDIGSTVQDDFFKSVVSRYHGYQVVDKAYIDATMAHSGAETPAAYIAALLNFCVPSLATTQENSPFYQVNNDSLDKAERLSMMTQFYLGVMNVYCRAQGISNKNFGEILDNNTELSQVLVDKIAEALTNGDNVENVIIDFFKVHQKVFKLSLDLSPADKDAIQAKFGITYRTVTAIKENPHMDDFMILDTEACGERDIFFTQKGLICTDFANMAPTIGPNHVYFDQIREEAATHPDVMRPQDEAVVEVDIEPEALMNKLGDIQWDRLPGEVADACRALPAFQIRQFGDDVAKGKQDEAEAILKASDDKQALLTTSAKFTDYSGRTFNCTAYEYAYWAKDTHMRRMLESHMDDATKTYLLDKIDEVERSGLAYQQHGVAYQNPHYDISFVLKDLSLDEFHKLQVMLGTSVERMQTATADNYQNLPFTATEYEQLKIELEKHKSWTITTLFYISPANAIANKLAFDFKSLITALDTYVTNYDRWDSHQREIAWLDVGKAQRDVPAHIAQEYCRRDRSCYPCPEFNDLTLPRDLTFYNLAGNMMSWFPLSYSSTGLGFDFGCFRAVYDFVRPASPQERTQCGGMNSQVADLEAVRRLEQVRTADLTQSREILNVETPNSAQRLS
ncbi:MAG: hypothetical protein P1U36_03000 [Legionellaceae bacterium]|nr:hypothetical protein [Legionellaceae bacterium]